MSIWQGAWHIVRHEMAKSKIGSVITILFSVYLALTTFTMFDITGERLDWTQNVLDWMFLAIFPVLGFSFNRASFVHLREDWSSQTLAQWRTMPIPVQSIAIGRLLMVAIHLVPAAAIFFTVQYYAVPDMKEVYDAGSYILSALFWLFYALGIATVYLYCELTLTGKQYTVICFASVFVIGAVAIAAWFADIAIVVDVMKAIRQGNWWMTVAALLCGGAAVVVGYKRICAKIKARTFF